MKKLSEQLWPIVKEYTRQVAEIMQCHEWHWIGTDDNGNGTIEVLDLDGYYFLDWGDVQIIVDRIDDWVKRYTTKEGVAEEVQAWQEWWLNDGSTEPHPIVDIFESRKNRAIRTRPSINLEAWLAGCPREPRKPTIDDELRLLCCQRETVKELVEKYRGARTLWNIFDNLSTEINVLKERVKERDAKLMEEMKESDAYKELVDCIDSTESTEKTEGTEY